MAEDEVKQKCKPCYEGLRVDWSQLLYRRGFNNPIHKFMNPDGTATSRVFKLRQKDEGCLSVDVAGQTTPERALGDTSRFLLFTISVEEVEKIQGITVHYDPLPDNNAHAAIWGMKDEDEITPALIAKKSKQVKVELTIIESVGKT